MLPGIATFVSYTRATSNISLLQVEAAYDIIFMQSMKRRLAGEMPVSSTVRFADVPTKKKVPQVSVWRCIDAHSIFCSAISRLAFHLGILNVHTTNHCAGQGQLGRARASWSGVPDAPEGGGNAAVCGVRRLSSVGSHPGALPQAMPAPPADWIPS